MLQRMNNPSSFPLQHVKLHCTLLGIAHDQSKFLSYQQMSWENVSMVDRMLSMCGASYRPRQHKQNSSAEIHFKKDSHIMVILFPLSILWRVSFRFLYTILCLALSKGKVGMRDAVVQVLLPLLASNLIQT